MLYRRTAITIVVALLLAACGDGAAADDTTTNAGVPTTVEAPAPATTAAPAPTATATDSTDGSVVQPGDAVSVHYTGTLDDGEVFDSSVGGPTLDFVAGAGQMIAGFDAAVIGMAVGDTKTVRIDPSDAYGERRDDLVIDVPRDQVPDDVAVGQELFDGSGNRVVVVEVRDDVVVVDANHRLAGQALTFEIELVSIN